MNLIYLDHSGFLLETSNVCFVFDYCTDPSDTVKRIHSNKIPLVFIVSHFHSDHFNPEIFDFAGDNTYYILSSDVKRKCKKYILPKSVTFISPGHIIEMSNFSLYAFNSTDCGCSFLLKFNGYNIFHAGDLNNWHWKEESTECEVAKAYNDFSRILSDINMFVESIDLVMFPVDARLGSDYYLGAKEFLQKFRIGTFVPMHFWDKPALAFDFDKYKSEKCSNYIGMYVHGEKIQINKL